jgi:hypothetical protein
MTTSGTSVFNLDLNNLVEESFERCGKELRTGYDLRTARRSLNLLTIEWANRGINLWTMDQGAISLVTGQAIYPVPNDTIQLLDTVIRQNNATTNQSDINISNIAEPTYSSIPNKLTQGRPIQYWFNRQSGETNPSDRCAQRYKLKQLRTQIVKTRPFNIKVCPECWDPDQPQLQLGMYPVNDPQAVRDPRPDVSYQVSGTSGLQILLTNSTDPLGFGYSEGGSRIIQWGYAPVGGARSDDAGLTPNNLVLGITLGTVTVVTT